MWFLLSQVVTAALSGAFGEEAKEPKDPDRSGGQCTTPCFFFLEGVIAPTPLVFYIYIYIYMGSGRFPGPMELLLQQLVRVSKTR